eukprot:1383478-Amorphochlora_amoeboformis.AAC.3
MNLAVMREHLYKDKKDLSDGTNLVYTYSKGFEYTNRVSQVSFSRNPGKASRMTGDISLCKDLAGLLGVAVAYCRRSYNSALPRSISCV